MKLIGIIIWTFISYIIGSIPFGLIIGKTFFGIDIREKGSGNLGGSNAIRVLGFLPGLAVLLLDGLKAFLAMTIVYKFQASAAIFAGVGACVGHCYPCFANYKGGKAVACFYGMLLATGIFLVEDVTFAFVFPLLVFLIVLGLTRYVSLSSMISSVFAAILSFILFDKIYAICITIVVILIIYRHYSNILRILNNTENKVSFIK